MSWKLWTFLAAKAAGCAIYFEGMREMSFSIMIASLAVMFISFAACLVLISIESGQKSQ